MTTEKKSNTVGIVLTGCAVVFILGLAITCGGIYYLIQNGANLAKTGLTNMAQGALVQIIDESLLPEDQKIGMKAEINRVAEGVKSDEISLEQLGSIVENMAESPAFTAIPVEVVRYAYLEPSGLSEEEKEDATKQLQRVMHGLFEGMIEENELDPAMDKIADKDNNDQYQFKEKVTDEELRGFIAECKKLADEKEIPDENFEVDLTAELKKAIDSVLIGPVDEGLPLEEEEEVILEEEILEPVVEEAVSE
ncbi:MAG: hypothetical protein COA78_17190 [Blastopirellula sp.]|nr:MAG: hypothetical protein COA78_17190 [Blastopirellula sp.]